MFTAILLKYENLINGYVLDLFIAYSSSCGVIRIRLRQFNLHKTNAANEELVISLFLQAWSSRKKADIPITLSLYSSSNKMGIFLLAARNINHQYIVERSIYEGKNKKIINQLALQINPNWYICIVYYVSITIYQVLKKPSIAIWAVHTHL